MFGFIGELLGISVVLRAYRARPGLTLLMLALFWGWAALTGAMIVRYAHLGEHPYVFEILPVVSCISPVVALVGVLLFTAADAFTNLFSGALTNTLGVAPPIDLYRWMGEPSPLLTWGAYVRLNLVGLMAYALLPGLLSRAALRIARGVVGLTRRRVLADGPSAGASLASQISGMGETVVSYLAAVAGHVAGTAVGGGLYYVDMWAEYFPIRQLTHPSGMPDPSCFKMDADYAVQSVVNGGTLAPAGGAGAVATSGGSPGPGQPEAGDAPGGGVGGDGKNLEYGDKILSLISKAGDAAKADADGAKVDADGARPDADGAKPDADALGTLTDIANILYDWQNLMQKDGMNWFEAGFTSISSNLAANWATGTIGTVDFAAGIFFPQSMQGYVPSNAVKDSVKAGVNAVKALGSALGGDEDAMDAYGESAHKGEQGKIAEGWANLADVFGSLAGDPNGSLEDFIDACKDIWDAGPLDLASDAIDAFAQDCLDGKEGPMAQAMAELAGGAGSLAGDPAGTTKQFGEDVKIIVEHGEPGEIIFGEEGSNNAVQILGPIGEGYKAAAELAGEAYEDPGAFVSDVKDTAIYVAEETGNAISNVAKSTWNGFKTGFGLWG